MTTCILTDDTNFSEHLPSIFIVGHTDSTYLGNFLQSTVLLGVIT